MVPTYGSDWDVNDQSKLKYDISTRTCGKLINWFEVDYNGNAWLCCPGWLPYSIGNILENSIIDIWHGERATELRNQISSGKWNYCQHSRCPHIVSGNLPIKSNSSLIIPELPTHINFSNDESCNLACPSCRVSKIMLTSGPEYEKRKRINDLLVDAFLTVPTDRNFEINITGSGDPFASKIFRNMLINIDGAMFPNCKINLQTNGTMMSNKVWNSIFRIHSNIRRIKISYDAANKYTYEDKIRLNGKWDHLLENCSQLESQKRQYPLLETHYDFVVQSDNVNEMEDFVRLCMVQFPTFNKINFFLLFDWSTWDKDTFNQKAIWQHNHPNHQNFIDILQNKIFDDPRINMGNIPKTLRNA